MSFSSSRSKAHNLERNSFNLNSDLGSPYFPRTSYGEKIKPMPMIYKKIGYEGDHKMISKIPAKGYKYVYRVKAAGEMTIDILNKIKETSCLKLVQNLDFDPYLCDTPGLKPLSDVLKKLRRLLHGMNLTIRRVKAKDEVKQFSLILARASNIRKMKIEIPNSSGVDCQDFHQITRGCKKFCSLKALDISLGGSKDILLNLHKIREISRRSLNLEKTRLYVYFSHLKPSSMETSLSVPSADVTKVKSKPQFLKNLKSISLKFVSKIAWSSFFDGVSLGESLHNYIRGLPVFTNPIHFSLTLDKTSVSSGLLDALTSSLPKLSNLKIVFLEINNVKLSQFEMMTLAKGFVDCKQIEHLTFKYMDNTILPMVDLLQFIIILAKHVVFPKLDLFFRKIFYPEWQTPETRRELENLENVKYTLTKQSIHIQKFLPIVESKETF